MKKNEKLEKSRKELLDKTERGRAILDEKLGVFKPYLINLLIFLGAMFMCKIFPTVGYLLAAVLCVGFLGSNTDGKLFKHIADLRKKKDDK